MNLTVREADGSDANLATVARIRNASVPDEPINVEMLRHWESTWDKTYFRMRLFCESEGETVASFGVSESQWSHVPGKYLFWLHVPPELRKRGIGSFAYDYAMEILNGREPSPTTIVASARENVADGIRFLEHRGFELKMREQKSRLVLAEFDPTRFDGAQQRLEDQGITVRTLAELQTTEPEWLQRLWNLSWPIEQDIPSLNPPTRFSIERYAKELDTPAFMPEAAFIALDGEEWVGISMLWKVPSEPDKLYTELTGVLRSHRRKGIATALKLRCIDWAAENGYARIDTDNEEKNPMYQLNLALGFKPLPAWLRYQKSVSDTEPRDAP